MVRVGGQEGKKGKDGKQGRFDGVDASFLDGNNRGDF